MRKIIMILLIVGVTYMFKDNLLNIYQHSVGSFIGTKTVSGVVLSKDVVANGVAGVKYVILVDNIQYSIDKPTWDKIQSGHQVEISYKLNEVQSVQIK